MLIKLYDNEDYEYPLIRIKDFAFEQFLKDLNTYRKDHEDYNIDDFLLWVEQMDYYIDHMNWDKEVFF